MALTGTGKYEQALISVFLGKNNMWLYAEPVGVQQAGLTMM
jgi:hypothetical protein